MKPSKSGQMSESFFLGALLAVTGGFLDAYTYLCRGQVFANAQTGNIVLLGVNLAQHNFSQAFYYFIPIFAFVFGIIVAELVKNRFKEHPNIHWRQIVIAAEIFILFPVAFLPQGQWNTAANIAIAFICSMQVESFRKLNGNAFATTMCTGNLRSASECMYRYVHNRDTKERNKALQYFGIILFFIAGAALGCLFTNLFSTKAILLCCFLLLLAFGAMFIHEVEEREQKRLHSKDNGMLK